MIVMMNVRRQSRRAPRPGAAASSSGRAARPCTWPPTPGARVMERIEHKTNEGKPPIQ
jgi:hypothetical protein